MATRLYLTDATAPYSPATLRGAWDATASSVTKALDPVLPISSLETLQSLTIAETDAGGDYDVLMYRGVSGPLAAQTVSGTVNMMAAVAELSTSLNAHWHLHIYVTQGDSDTPRGTLLTDYTEAAGVNEWPTDAVGVDLNAAQSLSSLAVSAGDRLVVEFGFVARNTSATSMSGRLYYGRAATTALADGAQEDTGSGYVEFSADLAWVVDTTAVTQFGVEYLDGQSATVNATQFGVEYLDAQDANVHVSQFGFEYLAPRIIETRVSQFGLELIIPYIEEVFEPGQSFGPLVWVEVLGPDGTTRAYAPVTLADPSTYYHGYKSPELLGVGRVARALSDEQGQYESQRFATTLDDVRRQWRGWLGEAATRLILNKRVVLRMISEPAWRAKLRPRTVAIGLIRDYRLE